ncbi:MAG: hypothetical protein ACI837_000657 [Crocinitomicaceae bacterium]|jgi:hypothetical protein
MNISLRFFCFLALTYLSPTLLIAQDTYYPPKLFIEISSNIQVGAKVEGETKTYINYRIESSNTNTNTAVNSYSNSYIKDVTYERTKKTNEDYYKSRPKASGLFGGIAKAFKGDFSGLADFGGGLIDHVMTPKYKTHETSTYKTVDQYKKFNSNNNTNVAINKQSLIKEITESETVDVNSGFIRFSIRIHNNAQKGVRVKTPQFVLYFRMPDGSREVVSFEDATAGENEVHWLPSNSFKDFEIKVESLNVKRLFTNYIDAEEIELNLNSLEIERDGTTLFAGEIEEQYEDEGIRIKYSNGTDSKEFYALVGDARPSVEELIRVYLNESQFEYYASTDSSTSIAEAVRKISYSENVLSDQKVDELTGEDLINWRKWLITVYDQNNTIIDFRIGDQLKPGYKIAISYFSAKSLLGKNYRPVIYSKKNVQMSADGSFSLDVDMKKGDQLIINNVRLNKLYTDKVSYSSEQASIAPNSSVMNSLSPLFLEAEAFLAEQRKFESVHIPEQNPGYGFNFGNPEPGTPSFYWMKPTQVVKVEKYTPGDYVYLRWFKGNEEIDQIIGAVSERAQKAFVIALIIRQMYNATKPDMRFEEPVPFGVLNANIQLTLNGPTNSPQVLALIDMLTSDGIGQSELEDSISSLASIKYTVPNDINAANNRWKNFMKPNTYYSFLASANRAVPPLMTYHSLGLGKHFPRMNASIDTRSTLNNGPWMPQINSPLAFGQFVFPPEKRSSVESLVNTNYDPPLLIPAQGNYTSLNGMSVEIKGNEKLFDITFDVTLIRTSK